MNTLHFTPADLEANREGRLSDAQIKKLDADLDTLRRQVRPKAISFAVILMINFAVRWTLDHSDKKPANGPFSDVGMVAMVLVMVVLVGCFVFALEWFSVRMFARSTLHHVEGEAQVINSHTRFLWWRTPIYKVKIWRNPLLRWKTFQFAEADSLAYFESGRRYRVSYLPHFDQTRVLSCEEIYDEKAKKDKR
jgi:hypothetical protein